VYVGGSFILNKSRFGVKFNFALYFNLVFQVTHVLLRLRTLKTSLLTEALMLSKREKNMLFCRSFVCSLKGNPETECLKKAFSRKLRKKEKPFCKQFEIFVFNFQQM
jgi:hypothetical protein